MALSVRHAGKIPSNYGDPMPSIAWGAADAKTAGGLLQ
jgi:hypothetical protein